MCKESSMMRNNGRNRNRYTIVALAALIPALGACGAGQPATEAAASEGAKRTAVVLAAEDVATATRAPLSAGVVLTGSLNPWEVVEIRAQVPGLVRNLRADRGVAVTRGQTLATIEADGIRSQAAAARAQLALAEQQLASARVLYEAGAMSELDFNAAQASYEAARAQAASAQESAAYATIVAPISGRVSDRMVSEGEAVNPGTPLFAVVDTDSLELRGQIPVDAAARVRVGMPVEFTIDAYPGRTFHGTVARIDPTADPATRQVGVYLRMPNTGHQLVGGLFATGRILTGSADESIVVPAAALRTAQGKSFVWTIEDGAAMRRDVVVGTRDEVRGIVQVLEGLTGGEQVVAAPGTLAEGALVRIGGGATEHSPAEAVEE